jgi:hypothetical protein
LKIALRPLTFSIVFTLLFGCSLVKPPPTRESVRIPPTAEKVRLSNQQIRSLRGFARIELIHQGKRVRARQAIALVKPGLIRLETLNSLDQPLLILATDGVTFQVMSLSESRFYTGTVSEGFAHFIHLRTSSEELVSLILGEIPPHGDPSVSYDSDRALYRLMFPASANWKTQTFWIDPDTLRVVDISKTDAFTGEEIHCHFSRFRRKGSVIFPMEIQIEVIGVNKRIALDFRKLEVNPPLPRDLFTLSVPRGVEVVEIRESAKEAPFVFPAQE